MLTFIKFRIKYPKSFKFLKEVKSFLLIFVIIFVIVFTTFNGRSFYNQIKYTFRIGIEKIDKFMAELPVGINKLYNVADSIVIPKININAPIVFPKNTDEKNLFKELENGTVHYPGSVNPGKVGNSILLGHSSAYPWYKGQYGSVFSLLNRLDENDEIIIFYKKHKYVYRITHKKIVNDTAVVNKQESKSQIVLLSCWPVGTTWNRIMIKGELVER
jgi:LPXTG-site transpeptidase (sortase) family protein